MAVHWCLSRYADSPIGVLSLSKRDFDVLRMLLFGLLGRICAKLNAEPAPLLFGFILELMKQAYLRRALLLLRRDPMVVIESPISATTLPMAVLALIMVLTPALRKTRAEAFVEWLPCIR